jgi:hypothetical protein
MDDETPGPCIEIYIEVTPLSSVKQKLQFAKKKNPIMSQGHLAFLFRFPPLPRINHITNTLH